MGYFWLLIFGVWVGKRVFFSEPKKKVCQHVYPDGKSAIEEGFLMNTCTLCGWDDYAG
jgi:hypothetical protein